MDSNSLPTAVPEVIYQRLPDGAVLFLPSEEVYFGLNEVGCMVWSLLPPASRTFNEICEAISARFPDVDRKMIEVDVRELLDDLVSQRLATFGPQVSGSSAGDKD